MDRPDELRQHIWDLLEVTEEPDTGKVRWDWVDILLLVLILLNVAAVILHTVEPLALRYERVFLWFEVFSVVVFTVEYIVRVWACTVDLRYRDPFRGRVRYMTSFYGVIDLLAVMPFYLALVGGGMFIDLRFLRALRLMRFARVLKIGRYTDAVDRFNSVFRARKSDLGVVVVGLLIVLVLASSAMYYVEGRESAVIPHGGKTTEQFSSIPETMWWAVTALTTIGYGSVEPRTGIGRLLGGFIQVLGIAFFALPAGILAAGYEEEIRRKRQVKEGVCPGCGRALAGGAVDADAEPN